MKRLCLAITSVFLLNTTYAATIKVTECNFDEDDVNYCSKQKMQAYQKAFDSQPVNFSRKYVLLKFQGNNGLNFVVINKNTGVVYPLRYSIGNFMSQDQTKELGKPLIQYSAQSSQFCIKGSVYAYRDAYTNVRACFYVNEKDKTFDRVDIPEELN